MRTLKRNVTNRIACILALALTLGQIPQPVYAVEKTDIIEPASESLITEEANDEVITDTAGDEIVESVASDVLLTSIPMSDASGNDNEISPDGDPQTINTWRSLSEKLYDGGEYMLVDDIRANGSTYNLKVPSGKTVTLDLNGHTIDHQLTSPKNGGEVICVEGDLTIIDSSLDKTGKITGGYQSGENMGGGVYICGGTFTMKGGSITGNKAANDHGKGGGVCVADGTFTMEGGGECQRKYIDIWRRCLG